LRKGKFSKKRGRSKNQFLFLGASTDGGKKMLKKMFKCMGVVIALCVGLLVFSPMSPAHGEEQVIRFICSSGGSGRAFQGGLRKFNEKFKGKYRVEVDVVAWEALADKLMLQFISGSPTYDVVPVGSESIAGMLHYLEPLDPFIEKYGPDVVSLFGEGEIRQCTYKGNVVLLPIRTGAHIVYYRRDLFDEAGLAPPQNLDEWVNAARKLTKRAADGTVERYGTGVNAASPAETVNDFVCLFMPLGGYLLTEDFKHASPSLKSQLAIDVLNALKTLYDEELTPEPLTWTEDNNVVGFQTDRIAFTFEYSARALRLEDPEESKVVGKMAYDVFPPSRIGPHPPSVVTGTWRFGIDKNTPKKEAAYQFIKFMSGYEAQEYMAFEWNNGPTVLSLYDDPEYHKLNPAAAAVKKALGSKDLTPRHWAPVPQSPEIMMAVHEEIQALLLGRQDAKQTGQNMYERIEKIMTER